MGKQKPTDFVKNRLKLGKARGLKKQSVTHTPLVVKTRRIAVAQQSVTTERAAEVTTRQLDLPALLVQLGHYSEHVRQEALAGVGEWVSKYPDALLLHVGELSAALVERLGDLYNAVRRALLAILPSVFERVPVRAMAAHMSVWLAHLASALSHTQSAIKVDALRVLQLLARYYAPLLAAPAAKAALARTLSPLAHQHASLARTAKDAPALLVLTLDTLLAAVEPDDEQDLNAFEDDVDAGDEGGQVRADDGKSRDDDDGMEVEESSEDDEAPLAVRSPTLAYASLSVATSSSSPASPSSTATSLSAWSQLVTPLLELWVEAVAAARERAMTVADAAHVASLAALLRRLLSAPAVLALSTAAASFQRHVLAAFPLDLRHTASPDAALSLALANAHLAALLLIHGGDGAAERVVHHAVAQLSRAVRDGRVADEAARVLRPLLGLLATARTASPLLAYPELSDALLAVTRALPPRSLLRPLLVRLTRAVLVDSEASRIMSASSSEAWLLALAKLVWQLGASSPALSVVAVDTLRAALAQSRRLDARVVAQAFTPLLASVVGTKRRLVLGPFVQYHPQLQRALLHALAFVVPFSEALLSSLALVLTHEAVHPSEFRLALEIITLGRHVGSPAELLSFLVTILHASIAAVRLADAESRLQLRQRSEAIFAAVRRGSLLAQLPLEEVLWKVSHDILGSRSDLAALLGLVSLLCRPQSASLVQTAALSTLLRELSFAAVKVCLAPNALDASDLILELIRELISWPQCYQIFSDSLASSLDPVHPADSHARILLALFAEKGFIAFLLYDPRSVKLQLRLKRLFQECQDRTFIGRIKAMVGDDIAPLQGADTQ